MIYKENQIVEAYIIGVEMGCRATCLEKDPSNDVKLLSHVLNLRLNQLIQRFKEDNNK